MLEVSGVWCMLLVLVLVLAVVLVLVAKDLSYPRLTEISLEVYSRGLSAATGEKREKPAGHMH